MASKRDGNHYAATPKVLQVDNEVIVQPFSDKLPAGGWWCHEYGRGVAYLVSPH